MEWELAARETVPSIRRRFVSEVPFHRLEFVNQTLPLLGESRGFRYVLPERLVLFSLQLHCLREGAALAKLAIRQSRRHRQGRDGQEKGRHDEEDFASPEAVNQAERCTCEHDHASG